MQDHISALAANGAAPPRVLLPAPGISLSKYSVIACDQFSARPEYWKEAERLVGSSPSTLNMILPEAWLGQDRAAAINAAMDRYLGDGTLTDAGSCFVFLRRVTSGGLRRGLVVALDLEQYGYTAGWQGMIRSTEGTVVDRLPARVEVRKNAPLELPHVMVLLNDRENRLMSMLDQSWDTLPELYDFDLMLDGGHISGRRVDLPELMGRIAGILSGLRRENDGFLYAMGDGNHSFAAAKLHWEQLKTQLTSEQAKDHPARWCMAELVNLYDPALVFRPIHRLLQGVRPEKAAAELGIDPSSPPPIRELQRLLDRWLAEHPEAKLEYIHGEDECRELGKAPDALPIILPEFDKTTLFEDVRRDGPLVRKSFSMGEARDKRYYLEARRIK